MQAQPLPSRPAGNEPDAQLRIQSKKSVLPYRLHGNKALIEECCTFRPRSRQGAGQFSEDLTYSEGCIFPTDDVTGSEEFLR